MTIDMTGLIPVTAVVASVLLLLAGKKRLFEVIATAASLLWLAVHVGIMAWPIQHRLGTLGIVVGAALLVCGIIVYLSTSNKREVTCSTVLAILGAVLLIPSLSGMV